MKNIHSRGIYEAPTVSVCENVDVILASNVILGDGDIGGSDIFDTDTIWL